MMRLLRADFYRLFRSKLFYALVVVYAAVALVFTFNSYAMYRAGYEASAFSTLMNGMGGGMGMLGILIALFSAVFVGHDYASGAVRNKIMAGCGRLKIYWSKLVCVTFAGLCVYLAYQLTGLAVGAPLMGFGEEGAVVAGYFFLGLFLVLAYSAVFTALVMLTQSTTVSLIVGIIAPLVVSLLSINVLGELQGHTDFIGDEAVYVPCDWPAWAQGIVRFVFALIPSGQASSVAMSFVATELAQTPALFFAYYALSCVWVVLSAAGGALLFRKADVR